MTARMGTVDPKNPSMKQAMAQAGSLHDVDELEDKGIRKVTVLSATRLQELLRVSVNRVLRAQLEGLAMTPEVRDEIAQRAQSEYERLVREGLETPGEGTPAPPPTSEQSLLDVLNREEKQLRDLTRATPLAENPPIAATAPPVQPAIDEAALAAFEARMVDNITKLLENERSAPALPVAPVENPDSARLVALEDRISKLLRALESTDRVIASTRPRRSGAPGGRASGPLDTKKNQLLSALFQANLQMTQLQDEKQG